MVLGHGSHADPASELGPAIKDAIKNTRKEKRHLEILAILSGTDGDPQDLDNQEKVLKAAGASVFLSSDEAIRYAGKLIRQLESGEKPVDDKIMKVEVTSLSGDFAAINVGLESFTESLKFQEARVVQVDWKPAAGGNPDLMALLEKMKG